MLSKVGTPFPKVEPALPQVEPMFSKVGTPLPKVEPPFPKVKPAFPNVKLPFTKVEPAFSKVFSALPNHFPGPRRAAIAFSVPGRRFYRAHAAFGRRRVGGAA